MPLLIIPWIIYLSLPFSLNPIAIFALRSNTRSNISDYSDDIQKKYL